MPAIETAAPERPATEPASLRRFYAFKLTTETSFTGAIWILYLQHRGFSLTQIGLAEAAFHLAPVLLEIPSGSFADLVGRRWSLAIGSLLIALSTALMFVAPSLPLMMLALFLNGASYSFRSGADQAFLYDSLGERQSGFAGILGKLMGASYVIAGATIWIGAALSDISYTWPFALAVGAGLAGVWLAVGLREAPVDGEHDTPRQTPRQHLGEAARILRGKPIVGMMLAFSGPFWAAGTVAFLYLQAAFADRGLSNSVIGLVIGGALLLNAVGASLAGRFDGRGGFSRQLMALAFLTGAGITGLAAGPVGVAIFAYLFANLASGLLEPLLFAWFNRQVPSAQRATLLSIESWTFSMTMIVVFPLGGWLAESAGWGVLFLVCGGAKIALALAIAVGIRLRGRETMPGASWRRDT
ncbi:MAG TPA: MFS transporter [Thermomicrobiales bacterium]|nr:MFS transporter [Thermomicrobiales bacterium]